MGPRASIAAPRGQEAVARCQRDESTTAQRVCNACAEDVLGSVMGTGQERACSSYRGTCTGSVELRIRGIIPPNRDIVGANRFGGLRYCRAPAAFSSTQHYFTEDDILQA